MTLELQTLAGTEVGFGRTREMSERGVYKVVIEYKEEALGKECLYTAHRLLMAAIDNLPFDVAAEIARLRAAGPGSLPGTEHAGDLPGRRGPRHSRPPPHRRQPGAIGLRRPARRICAAESDRTGAIAQEIAQDKDLTRKLLKAVGVPTPDGRPVTSAEDAWAAAEEFGVPVVVKPQDGNQGRGVATNLTTREQVLGAYEAAAKESRSVFVERYLPGNDYRLLVVGRKWWPPPAASRPRCSATGIRSVAELVSLVNADPRRGDDHATALSKIRLDAVSLAVLAEQGYTPASIPPAGSVVLIRRNANLSTGGTAIDVTDRVHPEVAARAVEAARVVGLDIAGVDVVACDISQPLDEQGGGIVEVNAAPGLRMHLEPSIGISRPVGEAIVDSLFPAGDDGRIPIVAVTGVNGKTTTTRLISHILRGTGRRVGMTCTDGIYIDDRRIDDEDCSGPQSAAERADEPRRRRSRAGNAPAAASSAPGWASTSATWPW